MRKLAVILMIAMLFSCSTFTSTEGPSWTHETPHPAGYVVFVGSGTGADNASARASAYRDILTQLGEGLGYDAVSLYYRTLLSLDSIPELDAAIVNTYTSPATGGVIWFAMLQIPQDRYQSSISEEYTAAIERTQKIESLLSSAMDSYRANRDTETITDVLSALSVSLDGPVMDDEYTPEKILAMAEEYLSNLEIAVSSVDGTDITVQLSRAKGIFHPPVVSALVNAQYQMLNGDGERVTTSFDLMTDSRGYAHFFRTNPYMLRRGIIIFSASVPSALLEEIEAKVPEGFLDGFKQIMWSSAVECSYSDDVALRQERTVIGVAEYGENGVQMSGNEALEAFSSYIENSRAGDYLIFSASGEEEEDALRYLQRTYPGMDDYVLLRVGIAGYENGAGKVFARADGRFVFCKAGSTEPYIVRELSVAGDGSDNEEATAAAFSRCGEAAAGMFLSEL